ncbi:MAG: hypothetical protein OXH01_04435 [Bacteroidetes bacterium]|nr:hypothetical protein [Bacteroidota bacterium]
MEFDDLFTPIDTIRFDASVPFGTLGSVDLSDQGEFLVMDFPSGPVHVFTASGRHIRTTDISQCSSDRTGYIWSARFLKNGGVVVVTSRAVYVLNADGSCSQRLSKIPPNFPSFCERQDTVYFMNHKRRWTPQIHAYSLESGKVRNYNLRKPRFPLSTAAEWGNTGHQIACFDRGIFYRYAESSDGEPLWPGSDPVLFQPMFYRPPERDVTARGNDGLNAQMEELKSEFTYSDGIFGLDQNHRMVTFEETAEFNMNIVNMHTETGISTTYDESLSIELTKNGLMYTFGGYELLPSGERGNRTLVVWQFHPF